MATPKDVIDAIRITIGPDWTWNQVLLQLEDNAKLAALGFGDEDLNAIADAHTIAALGAGDRLALMLDLPTDPERAQIALRVARSDLEDLSRLRDTVAALGLERASIRLAAAVLEAAESLAGNGDAPTA